MTLANSATFGITLQALLSVVVVVRVVEADAS